MAVTKSPPSAAGRQWTVGLNVAMMVVLCLALVAGLQYIGYTWSTRADVTSSGVNSLSEGTTNLLAGLDSNVRLTSLYFKTDIEDEDQAKYRSHVADLIDLYRVSNRSKIAAETINPLQDHEKRKELVNRLLSIGKFKDQAEKYRAAKDEFLNGLAQRIGETMSTELSQIQALNTTAGETDERLLGQVQILYERLQGEVQSAGQEISDALAAEVPDYGGAISLIRQLLSKSSQTFKAVIDASPQVANNPDQFAAPVVEFFATAEQRYAGLLSDIDALTKKLADLPKLDMDEIIRGVGPMSNAIVVETDKDARVLPFAEIWPVANRNNPVGGFAGRRFSGEQKLTSAILQLTNETKPAVVFVRYGGDPLLFGGFMPGQPRPVYAQMKSTLEDVNFSVQEWDLASQDEPPAIDPAPSRVIYLVLPPNAPPRNPMMGQQPQQPEFSDADLKKLTDAMGDAPRALFLAGFELSQFGMPREYGYKDYLKDNWGIEVPADRLLLKANPIAPGKYAFRSAPIMMSDFTFGDNPIVASLGSSRTILPVVTPIEIADKLPEGETVDRLAWLEKTDGLWAVKDINHYLQQQAAEYIVPAEEDYSSEFTVAVAAKNGDGKIVVIASDKFSEDSFAMATDVMLGSQGLQFRQRNPGNVTLVVNTLHWLNDNTQWMNLGAPIDEATIAVEPDSAAMTAVRAIAWFGLPGLALCSGLLMWWVRRS